MSTLGMTTLEAFAATPASLSDMSREELLSRHDAMPEDGNVLLALYERDYRLPSATRWEEALSLLELSRNQEQLQIALNCQLALDQDGDSQGRCRSLPQVIAGSADDYTRSIAARLYAVAAYNDNDLEGMLSRNRTALRFARRSGSRRALSNALNINAFILYRSGVLDSALAQFDEARRVLDPIAHEDIVRTLAVNNANALLMAGQPEAALESYRKAAVTNGQDSPRRMLTLHANMAEAELALGKPEAAIDLLEPWFATDAVPELPKPLYLHGTLMLTKAWLRAGAVERSLTSYAQLAAWADSENDPLAQQRINLDFALAMNELERFSEAIEPLESAVSYFRTEGDQWHLQQALDALAIAYRQTNRPEEAFEAQAQARVLQAAMQTDKHQRALAYQRTELDADQAEFSRSLASQQTEVRLAEARLAQTRWVALLLIGVLACALTYLYLSRRLKQRDLQASQLESHELEQLVVERTNALESELSARLLLQEERQLLQMQLAENDKLRAIGQLTSGVAHDFNNLMTVVTLSAELIESDSQHLNDRQRQALKDILISTDSAATITGKLLAYARQQPQALVSIQLDEFLREAAPLFEQTLSEPISFELKVEPLWIKVDKANLTSALINLLANAREAIDGAGRVQLVAGKETSGERPGALDPEKGAYAVIEVRDDGRGMNETQLRRATEPFFTTKGDNNRSGLGLSMVYGFAKQSGGELTLARGSNGGTTATLWLPLAEASILKEEPQNLPAPVPTLTGTALLVEDQPELRSAMERLIGGLGLDVIAVANADLALLRVEDGLRPDLLISDIVMPGSIDGKQLADRLLDRLPELSILLVSGYSDITSDRYRILRKPFNINELRREIGASLGVAIRAA